MNSSYRKKLIEVALPLEAINKESAREKSIRHGHPSTLHLWWARRPLAACRAVLFSSLVDDPSAWPELFPSEAEQEKERLRLFSIIEEFVVWENLNNSEVLLHAQTEIARSIARNKGDKMPVGGDSIRNYILENAPPILDPFCGGGSIPLEAQRLGLKAYGSDLNPVAVLITKALIELPPKFIGKPPINLESRKNTTLNDLWPGAKGIAEDIQYYGNWIRNEAEKRIGYLYPKVNITVEMAENRPDIKKYVGRELTVIAWLWARTVASPNPAIQNAHVPLIQSYWLSKKKGREKWLEPIIDQSNNTYRFNIKFGTPELSKKMMIESGTKIGRGCKFQCIISKEPIPDSYIKDQGVKNQLGQRLIAIVAEGDHERIYISPIREHEEKILSVDLPTDITNINLKIADDKRAIWCTLYGLNTFDKLFTSRQLITLITLSDLIKEVRKLIIKDAIDSGLYKNDDCSLNDRGVGAVAYSDAVATYLAMGIDRLAMTDNTLVRWNPVGEKAQHVFGRQGIPMIWNFAEPNFFSTTTGSISAAIELLVNPFKQLNNNYNIYNSASIQLDARQALYKIDNPMISTDPPYYDNIGYADLSDFFYVWLRRSLNEIYPSLFSTLLTPKMQELIASPYRHGGDRTKSQIFFEEGLGKVFDNIYHTQNIEFPFTIYYAFKQSEEGDEDKSNPTIISTGWETMLSGLVQAGFLICGTWPLRTEMKTRQVAMGTNALASSIVLVCYPRKINAPIATRREFINTLKNELPLALHTLKEGNIAPVDLAQASIGPGMAIFTRYSKVMESDGSPMTVRNALSIINKTLDEVLAEDENEFDPDTRWAIAWFDQYGMNEGPFGSAETLSRAKNTAINGLVEAGIINAHSGKVKLFARSELPIDWDPISDSRLTVWETTQHLIMAIEDKGEASAAELLSKIGSGMGDNARDLAYRLYSICERKKWSQEALAYNSLIKSWPEITNLVKASTRQKKAQRTLFNEEGS